MNISILFGGTSTEHKISIQTGLSIAEAIKGRHSIDMVKLDQNFYKYVKNKIKTNVVFNALHGGDGENGRVQSFLELNNIVYTGSNSKASQIAMDKNITKLIAKSIEVQTPNWILLKKNIENNFVIDSTVSSKFQFPFVVKPGNEGSTYGLSIVRDGEALSDAIGLAGEYSSEVLIEEYIAGRELTVGILGKKALPVLEIKPSKDLYDYECKYKEGMSEYIVPAELSDTVASKIKEDALKIYNTIGCRHYARVDFRLNDDSKYYFLEINTLPGMTSTSLFPKAAKAAGIEFPELINIIINMAIAEG